jgi:hypothetical protein
MYQPASRRGVIPLPIAARSLDRQIRDFVSGKNDGEGLLHALYDEVLNEAVPERLLRMLARPAI